MVSRRNFLTITIIMFIILFMFQLSGVVRENWNDYQVNSYSSNSINLLTTESFYTLKPVEENQKRFIGFVGDIKDGKLGATVEQWCTYTKRSVVVSSDIKSITFADGLKPEAIFIDSKYFNASLETTYLNQLINNGINIIFCNLPDYSVISSNKELQRILGIRKINTNNFHLKGVKFFEGFLLGGEQNYIAKTNEDKEQQDLNLVIPWYIVSSGTKSYVVGIEDSVKYGDVDTKNMNAPAIIWRNSIGHQRVFAINGDYLDDDAGFGILSAIMSEMKSYDIYPVINSQNLVLANYPILANENLQDMNRLYSRSSREVMRDIIWPNLVMLTSAINSRVTCMMSPKLDYTDAEKCDPKLLSFFFKLANEQKGEIGLSFSQHSNIDLTDRLDFDYKFIHNAMPKYKFSSFYPDKIPRERLSKLLQSSLLSNVSIVLYQYSSGKKFVEYLDNKVLQINSTNNGFSHTYREDLRLRSFETALAYSTVLADIKNVVFPQNDKERWETMYNNLSKYMVTYWRPYSSFSDTVLSEADLRIRKFLAMDFSESRIDNEITVNLKNVSQNWFILRLHGENVTKVIGGKSTKIEDDVFLIEANNSTLKIKVKDMGKIPSY